MTDLRSSNKCKPSEYSTSTFVLKNVGMLTFCCLKCDKLRLDTDVDRAGPDCPKLRLSEPDGFPVGSHLLL